MIRSVVPGGEEFGGSLVDGVPIRTSVIAAHILFYFLWADSGHQFKQSKKTKLQCLLRIRRQPSEPQIDLPETCATWVSHASRSSVLRSARVLRQTTTHIEASSSSYSSLFLSQHETRGPSATCNSCNCCNSTLHSSQR